MAKNRTSQEEKAWKKSRGFEEKNKRKLCDAFEDAGKRMLQFLEDSEDLKVRQSESPEEAGHMLFQIFRQEENEVYIARWDAQLKGLVEL